MDIPIYCVQCLKPACKAVCPVNAIKVDEKTGIVKIDNDSCIGCRMCMVACPIGAISMDSVNKKFLKCDLCEGRPRCVEYCEPKALEYVLSSTASSGKMRKNAKKFVDLVTTR